MISWLLLEQNRSRLFRWTTILGGFAVVQILVQGMNATAGFLLVRTMEKPDYAWFTIASGMSAALAVMSDSGAGNAVTSIGGTVWEDRASLKGLVIAALRMRRKLAALSSVFVASISFWLLWRNGATVVFALGLTAVALAPIWQMSATSVFSVVNRLHSRARQLQVADLVPAAVRLSLTAVLAVADWINPLTALLAVLAAHVTQNVIVRRQVMPLLGENTEPTNVEKHTEGVWRFIRQLMPNCLFTCVQSQINTWLISVFATSSEVADLGALNRLGIIFAVLGGPVGQFVAPAFARAKDKKKLWGIALGVLAGVLLFTGVLVFAAWLKGEWFLWLLGEKYAHLHKELVLILMAMSASCVSQMIWALNSARGWLRGAWAIIPLTLSVQVAAIIMLPLHTVAGQACFGIATAVVLCMHAFLVCGLGLTHPQRVHAI